MIQLPFLPKSYHRMGHYVPTAESILAPTVTIKQPTVWDVSFYNGAINWSTVAPRPFGVIVKATEWTSTDPQFISNWQQLGALKIPRACYHFYHNGQIFYNSARQANSFVAAIQKAGGFTENDYFIIDDEEVDSKGNSLLSASELVNFLYNVQVGLGLKDTSHLLIYSTAALLNNLSFAKLQPGQPQWIKQIRSWTAGYPSSPDSFSVPPAAYTPDQSRYGKVVLWQYSDSVAPFGDINWIDPSFANEWAGQVAPPQPPAPQPTPITINDIEIKVQDNQLQSVDVDGVDYTNKSHLTIGVTPLPAPAPQPQPAPQPVPPPTVPPVQNDIVYAIIRTQIITNPLTENGKATPAVMRIDDHPADAWPAMAGNKGQASDVTDSRRAFVVALNPDPRGSHYVNDTVGAMLINSPGHVESLDCQHNIISSPNIFKNNCMKLNCFQSDEDFAQFAGKVTFENRPDLIFKCLAEDIKGNFSKVGSGVDAYAPLTACAVSQHGTGELWVGVEYLELFPTLPIDVTITAQSGLNVHTTFSFDPATVIPGAAYPFNANVTIYAYRPIGASVFGQTDRGWICMVDRRTSPTGTFFTSWKLETDGVIP